MAATDAQKLRRKLGEVVPSGGNDSDTLFTDEEIDEILEENDDLASATVAGWEEKAAKLSALVDVAEGASRRSLSAQHRQALSMMKYYSNQVSSVTTIHKLTRPGGRP